jgi:hypothetical protein
MVVTLLVVTDIHHITGKQCKIKLLFHNYTVS